MEDQRYTVELTYDQVCEIRSQFLLLLDEDKKTVDKLTKLKHSAETQCKTKEQMKYILGLIGMFQRELKAHVGIFEIFNAICDEVEPWTDGTEPTAREKLASII